MILSSLAAEIRSAAPESLVLAWGVVTALTTSPNAVTAKMNGSSQTTSGIRYLSGYAPTVGDTIAVLEWPAQHGRDYLALGKTA